MLQITRFTTVGLLATATHLGVATALMAIEWNPYLANIAAFTVAFQISFWMHLRWSFSSGDARVWGAMGKFLAVALTGFALNNALFFVSLTAFNIRPEYSLAFILVFVAALTFILCKFWVFNPRVA